MLFEFVGRALAATYLWIFPPVDQPPINNFATDNAANMQQLVCDAFELPIDQAINQFGICDYRLVEWYNNNHINYLARDAGVTAVTQVNAAKRQLIGYLTDFRHEYEPTFTYDPRYLFDSCAKIAIIVTSGAFLYGLFFHRETLRPIESMLSYLHPLHRKLIGGFTLWAIGCHTIAGLSKYKVARQCKKAINHLENTMKK